MQDMRCNFEGGGIVGTKPSLGLCILVFRNSVIGSDIVNVKSKISMPIPALFLKQDHFTRICHIGGGGI